MQSVYDHGKHLANGSDLSNYYYFRKGLTDEEVQEVLRLAEASPAVQGKVGTQMDPSYRSSEIRWLDQAQWLHEKLARYVREANRAMWKFDLVGFGESLQVGTYSAESNGHYDWHMDVGKTNCCRKVSVSVQLTDPSEYEGGDLEFFYSRKVRTAPKEKGTVVLFPSCMMHRVTPVTKGVRQSLVVWITGPPFR